ncbi:DUF397 domain-containing protein [Verrucosispora sp. WMMA2044]|uniref:DUF397 domain-containing protein n=1 Tax=Verrucosispora sp. WMMA2044 TaxID=3016419 RepID=UPI00248D137B|nr:DUF397 domain-containing protein [Verrucosispora sp. WMMA2044]WBB48499.1 DUF397 domain-containing protein [Verrucosispora sp. WMMA2044]
MEKNEYSAPLWTRRSSKCANDHCVTVSRHDRGVDIFDSTDPGTALSFPDRTWRAFLLTFANPRSSRDSEPTRLA